MQSCMHAFMLTVETSYTTYIIVHTYIPADRPVHTKPRYNLGLKSLGFRVYRVYRAYIIIRLIGFWAAAVEGPLTTTEK